MGDTERRDGVERAAIARGELYKTLAQLQKNLNYPRRIDEKISAGFSRVRRFRALRPAVFACGVFVVAAAVGAGVWAVTKIVCRRFL